MSSEVAALLRKQGPELDQLYREGSPDRIPSGTMRGTAIVLPGTFLSPALASVARLFAWQGKVFSLFTPPATGVLINRVSPLRLRLIVARVYRGESWFDGKQTIIIDYSFTSFIAGAVRDEIREVAPGMFIGIVWFGKRKLIHFALEVPQLSQHPRRSRDAL